MHDIALPAMGGTTRLIGPGDPGAARAWLERYEARLSRFRADSELARLNQDPRDRVPVSPMLRAAIQAALWAAGRSHGLCDPTLGSHARVLVTREAIVRPPGIALDTGATGKGLAADQLARMTGGTADCSGDVRVTGTRDVLVEHPLTREPAAALRVTNAGVATSGHANRPGHVLDPRTGEPAMGLLQATALAPSALEAEALATAALVSGDRRALPHGGVLIHPDGDVEVVR